MRIEILGSAAGGGFPQWNCNCRNCQALRAGTFQGKARTQTQVAISNDNRHWLLLNASPDLRLQIEAAPSLHPRDGLRQSPVSGVILTSADIDQIAGLLSLRELQPFEVFCTASLRTILQKHNSVFAMLNRVPNQVQWREIRAGQDFVVPSGESAGISCSPVSLGSRYPVYAAEQAGSLHPEDALLGLVLESSSGGRVAYMPAVPDISPTLLARLETVDLILFDGTFWSDDELIRVQGSGATAREMGHIPISGEDGTLRRLAGLRRPRKVFIHVNNTNPILDESSQSHQEVGAAGWEIAADGWRLNV